MWAEQYSVTGLCRAGRRSYRPCLVFVKSLTDSVQCVHTTDLSVSLPHRSDQFFPMMTLDCAIMVKYLIFVAYNYYYHFFIIKTKQKNLFAKHIIVRRLFRNIHPSISSSRSFIHLSMILSPPLPPCTSCNYVNVFIIHQ